jgi:phosphate transport system substrate-binding protein
VLAALVAALLVPVLAGCGDNTPPSLPVSASMRRVIGTDALRVTGEHAGIGSSAQQASMEAWAAGYGQYQPQAVVAYDPQGSGAGVTAFLQGAVSWAGTDIPLTPAQRSRSTAVC